MKQLSSSLLPSVFFFFVLRWAERLYMYIMYSTPHVHSPCTHEEAQVYIDSATIVHSRPAEK